MNKIKNAICIILTIMCILTLYVNGIFIEHLINYEKYKTINIISIALIIIPIIFLVKYIIVIKNKDKHFDIKKMQNTIIIFSASIFFVALVDVLRYFLLVIDFKPKSIYFPNFLVKYIVPSQIIYFILFVWTQTLNKIKIKVNLLDKFKIASNVISVILFNICALTANNMDYLTPYISLLLMILQMFFIFRMNKNPILTNIYNILLVCYNIFLLLLMIFNDSNIGFVLQVLFGLLTLALSLSIVFNFKRKILKIVMCLITIGVYIFSIIEPIKEYIIKPIEEKKQKEQMIINFKKGNEYSKKGNYENLKLSYDLIINNKEEMRNFIYTFFDSGMNEIEANCSQDYKECDKDFDSMFDEQKGFVYSNFTSVYNGAYRLSGWVSEGEINISKHNYYSKDERKKINEKINKIFNENFDKNKTEGENIKKFHDYIINNTKYVAETKTNNAYSLLYEGKSASLGYTHVMSLLLDKMKVRNIMITSNNHIWNLVYIDGKWKHLDAAWDDPITPSGKDIVSYEYFLIDTSTLISYKTNVHNFDKELYKGFIN